MYMQYVHSTGHLGPVSAPGTQPVEEDVQRSQSLEEGKWITPNHTAIKYKPKRIATGRKSDVGKPLNNTGTASSPKTLSWDTVMFRKCSKCKYT